MYYDDVSGIMNTAEEYLGDLGYREPLKKLTLKPNEPLLPKIPEIIERYNELESNYEELAEKFRRSINDALSSIENLSQRINSIHTKLNYIEHELRGRIR